MKERLTKILCALVVAAVVVAAPARMNAQTIFSNFAGTNGYNTSEANPAGNDFAGDVVGQAVGFASLATTNLFKMSIALSDIFGTNSEAVTVALRSNSGSNLPDGVIESWTLLPGALGPFGNNNPPVMFLSALHPLVTAGTKYWVSVFGGASDPVAWNLATTGLGTTATTVDGGANWYSLGLTPGALSLEGPVSAVPEPGSLALLGTGLLSLGGGIRFRGRRK